MPRQVRAPMLLRLWAVLVVPLAVALAGCSSEPGPTAATPALTDAAAVPQRIVSLAPALTSILFRIGAGPRVVGVTRFCDDPPAVAALPRVGGFADPDLEAIVALKPDLVVAAESPPAAAILAKLGTLGIRTVSVKQDSLAATWAAFPVLGRAVGGEAEAAAVSAKIQAELAELAPKVRGLRGRRVLFVFGRPPLVVAGPGSYGDELLRLAGAINAAGDSPLPWPKLTAEEVVRAQPAVILDASVGMGTYDLTFWQTLPGLAGVDVQAATHPGLLQPGPRVVEAMRWLVERFP